MIRVSISKQVLNPVEVKVKGTVYGIKFPEKLVCILSPKMGTDPK
jgi:hypothetical protein